MINSKRWIPYYFLAPGFILLLVFRIFPMFSAVSESLFNISFTSPSGKEFIGLGNYIKLFKDPILWQSFKALLKFSIIVNPLQIISALGLALLTNQQLKGIRIFRSIFIIPLAIAISVASVLWGLVLSRSGLFNGILSAIGIPPQPLLTDAGQAMWCIILIVTWLGVPYWTLFFLAGLQGISHEVLEAAMVDGVRGIQMFRFITLPLLRRVITFVVVADTIINFVLFVPVYVLTSGGPQLTTNFVIYEAYRRGLIYGDLGTSSAMVIILLLFIGIVVAVEFYLLRERGEKGVFN